MRLSKIALAAASVTMAFGPTAARAEYCQPGSGCVLPLPGPTTSVPVQTSSPAPLIEEEAGGFNILPFLLGAAVLGLAAYFLFLNDDEDDLPLPGPTPSP